MLRNMAAYLSIALAVLRTEHRLPRLEMLEQAFKAPGTALLNKPGFFNDDSKGARAPLSKGWRDVTPPAHRALGVGVSEETGDQSMRERALPESFHPGLDSMER
ncbi:hypothetical protein AOQ84DRAFT_222864 [Glonium stellatum]|uniref:Uncharacterized protein n=1 Tax=Glonium stellatum TaxID=574774 RepID=A0A8E2JY74_9PEZI|nr:hypothetical protein AOQ84DRAFT_222864 [Glonium stellatum]